MGKSQRLLSFVNNSITQGYVTQWLHKEKFTECSGGHLGRKQAFNTIIKHTTPCQIKSFMDKWA